MYQCISVSVYQYQYLFFSSGEVGPLIGRDVLYLQLLRVLPLWRVGHPHLVTLEDLRRAALPAAGPATVALPVAQLIRL